MTASPALNTRRLEQEAERLRHHLLAAGFAVSVEQAREALASVHGAPNWATLARQGASRAPECFHIAVIGANEIVGDVVYAFGLAGAISVMLHKVRLLLRNHTFTTVKRELDPAYLLVLQLAGPDVWARVSLEHGPVHDAALFVQVTPEVEQFTRHGELAETLAYVVEHTVGLREQVRPLGELPYEERLSEACRDALEGEPWAQRYADVVLDLERLARAGKLLWRRSVKEIQAMLPRLAGLDVEQASKILSAAALALSLHGQDLEDVAYGDRGLRIRPAEQDLPALAVASARPVLH